MDAKSEARLFAMLDTMSIEVAKIGPMAIEVAKLSIEVAKIAPMAIEVAKLSSEVAALSTETRQGFERIERRMGNFESRVEALEDRHRAPEAL